MKRIIILLLSACCLSGAAFNQAQQLFLLCVRKAPPAPPLPYDAEVEYLESTGTQWIDTGIHGRDGLQVRTRAMPIVGYVYGTNLSKTYLVFRLSADAQHLSGGAWSPSVNFTDFPVSSGAIHEILADTTSGNKSVAIDGTTVRSWTSTSTAVSTLTLGLFAYHNSSMLESHYGQSRIYSFSVHDTSTGQLLLDLIPVRFTNEQGQSEGAMYDRLGVGGMNPDGSPRTDGLYRNRGTGAFIIGPAK